MVTIDFGLPTTVDAINADYEARNVPRNRLGLSQAGHQCKRCLWYIHHGFPAKQPEGRVLRLFQLGNILEDQTIVDLKSAGVSHHSSQKEVRHTRGNLTLTGHIDGIVEGLLESPETPHLFEHKTCSLKKYNELIKCGSYQKWNEVYYWQVQFYMLGLKLTRAAAFVYCKDNSEPCIWRESSWTGKPRLTNSMPSLTPSLKPCRRKEVARRRHGMKRNGATITLSVGNNETLRKLLTLGRGNLWKVVYCAVRWVCRKVQAV